MSSSSGGWEVQEHVPTDSFSGEACFLVLSWHFLSVSHGRRSKGALSGLRMSVLIPFLRAMPLWPHHPQRLCLWMQKHSDHSTYQGAVSDWAPGKASSKHVSSGAYLYGINPEMFTNGFVLQLNIKCCNKLWRLLSLTTADRNWRGFPLPLPARLWAGRVPALVSHKGSRTPLNLGAS